MSIYPNPSLAAAMSACGSCPKLSRQKFPQRLTSYSYHRIYIKVVVRAVNSVRCLIASVMDRCKAYANCRRHCVLLPVFGQAKSLLLLGSVSRNPAPLSKRGRLWRLFAALSDAIFPKVLSIRAFLWRTLRKGVALVV